MYTIIGGDGKEYGPATAQQIHAWIAAGRANLDTQAKAEGTNEWKRLAEYAEFIAEAEPPPAAVATLAEGNLAGRLSRLGACFINGVFTALCAMPLMNPDYAGPSARNGYSFALSDMFKKYTGMRNLMSDGWPLILFVVIQVIMLSTLGQSIGKRLCRIRIVRHRDGSNPGFLRAVVLRAVVPELIGAIPNFGTIFVVTDIFFIFSRNRRCLHDLIADTVVVRAT